MKATFRSSTAWLHTWAGLLVGWVLFFMFLTGTAGYFDTEIDRWMQPERPMGYADVPAVHAAANGLRRLEAQAPGAEQWFISLPGNRDNPDLRIFWRARSEVPGQRGASKNEQLDSATGAPLTYRATGGGQLLYRMHYSLHYLPTTTAYWIAGICTMFMLVAIVTGVIIHRRIFVDFFTFRPARGQRSWLDLHNVLSVVALPFHLMITYSGLIFFGYLYMAPIIAANYGPGEQNRQVYFDELFSRQQPSGPADTPAPLNPLAPLLAQAEERWGAEQVRFIDIRHPGDANARVTIGRHADSPLRSSERLVFDGVRGTLLEEGQAVTSTSKAIRDVFLGLHEGLFAGLALRWLYFLWGLLGTGMIATGLVLWTVKRRAKSLKAGQPNVGLTLVEHLNVGTIVGLPIGIAVYFWANRLIPVTFDGRAAWEAHAMFIAWGLMLLWPLLRPIGRAWVELLGLAAVLYALLPLLNAVTTERHLGVTLPHGDWVLAGFDLTMLGFGLAFACAAWVVQRHVQPAVAGRRRASMATPAPQRAGVSG
jgi:uncharacterized iron-regulated membrane protein